MTILNDIPGQEGKPSRASVVRETVAMYKGRPLIVELWRHGIRFRRKGTQQRSPLLPYEAAFEAAFKILAIEERKDQKPRM